LRVNFENFGHTPKNKIFRLVKLLPICTRLKTLIQEMWVNFKNFGFLTSKILSRSGLYGLKFDR